MSTSHAAATEPGAQPDSPDPPPPEDDSESRRWREFATDSETDTGVDTRPPGRFRRAMRRVGRGMRGESAIAAYVSLALTAAMNWRVLRDPAGAIPHDLGDPLQQTHILAWGGHAIWNDPSKLFDANHFYPESYTFAFSDTLLGYLPASLIGSGYSAALWRYNIVYLLTFALAFFGCYVLLRQLGARVAASALGAAAVAYAPWKLAHDGHLNILSIGGIALALAMLARGHGYSLRHGYRPGRTKLGWAIAGWLVAAWQISLGFAIGVPFGYLLGGICVVSLIAWLFKKRPRVPWRLAVADLLGALVFAGVSIAMALPYFKVLDQHPEAARDLEYVDWFSPFWSSFFISPGESGLWGDAHAPARETMYWQAETTLLVGFTVLALAVVGLVWSSWSRVQRGCLFVGVLVTGSLALGTNFIDDGQWMYVLAFKYLPGFDALRTPGRLVLYVSLLLAILAAGTLTRLAERIDHYAASEALDNRWRPGVPVPVRLALFLPVLLVLAEGHNVSDVPEVPDSPVAMSEVDGPMLMLPSDGGNDFVVPYWTIDGFPRVVNGTASFVPTSQQEIRDHSLTFPSPQSVEELRADGVKTVVAARDRLPGTPWEHLLDIPAADPSVKIEDRGDVVLYRL